MPPGFSQLRALLVSPPDCPAILGVWASGKVRDHLLDLIGIS